MASPRPRLPPVTMTLRTGTHQLAGAAQLQGGDETQLRRDLVCGQHAAAGAQQVTLDFIERRGIGRILTVRQHDFCTTRAPVSGLRRALTRDIRTRGSALSTDSTSSG